MKICGRHGITNWLEERRELDISERHLELLCLRLLMPDVEPRDAVGQRQKTDTDEHIVYDNKGRAYEELGLADIDLDSAMNAYFASYHLQYPLVHEPRSRAQYSSIIPRTTERTGFRGTSLYARCYQAFSTATPRIENNNHDLKLFEGCKIGISKIDVWRRQYHSICRC